MSPIVFTQTRPVEHSNTDLMDSKEIIAEVYLAKFTKHRQEGPGT